VVAVLLGIDIGTSSTKGVLCDPGGQVLATAVRPHVTSMPRAGWAEHDAMTVWWADVCAVSRELLAQAGGVEVLGICVSGIGPCLLVTDEAGTPLRPAILYGVDTRAGAEIEELTSRYGADAILARGGSPLTSQAIGPKLLWLERNEPAVWAASRRMFMASSYAIWRLTGEYVLDHHSASQCDPMYDMTAGQWAPDWASQLAGPISLPPLTWPGSLAGYITADASAATGIPAGTPVAGGTIDAWSEAVSAGVLHPGEYMIMYGTTMFFIATASRPLADRRLWCTAGAFPGTWSLAGGMASSGSVVAWGSELTGVGYPELMAQAAAVPPGADGLLVLPYFAGERTPLFDAQARGTIFGLTLRHGRAQLFRALLEATAYGARHNLETMADAGARLDRAVAVGGGAASKVWLQIVSDVTGRPQEVPAVTIGAAYGDAYLAGLATGAVSHVPAPATGAGAGAGASAGTGWARTEYVITPDPAVRSRYTELFGLYRSAYAQTAPTSHALAALQEHSP
jgi:xylulokinase